MGARGDLIVAWQAGGRVIAAVQPAGQDLRARLSPCAAPGAVGRVAGARRATLRGDAVAAWMDTSQSPKVVQAAVRRAGQGSFDTPASNVASRAAVSAPDAAMGPNGRAVVTWVSRFVERAELSSTGRWGRGGPGSAVRATVCSRRPRRSRTPAATRRSSGTARPGHHAG